MRSQLDLFASPTPDRQDRPTARKTVAKTHEMSEADMIGRLKDSGRYRILQRLEPAPVVSNADNQAYPRLGVIIDTETTGLNPATDEVIEFGAVAFRFADDGSIGDVCGTFGALQEPSTPISAEITRITGITDAMVKGQKISLPDVEAFMADADLVIAHNAGFDRPFCERLSPVFANKPWACSVKEIDWTTRGYEGTKLGYLIGQSGYFHNGHRAEDDCQALLAVLRQNRDHDPNGVTPFAELLQASQRARLRIYAQNSPFDMKDHLKARGYRWSDGSDGRPKSWWTEVAEQDFDDELTYLRTEIYPWPDADPLTVKLTATERYKEKIALSKSR